MSVITTRGFYMDKGESEARGFIDSLRLSRANLSQGLDRVLKELNPEVERGNSFFRECSGNIERNLERGNLDQALDWAVRWAEGTGRYKDLKGLISGIPVEEITDVVPAEA